MKIKVSCAVCGREFSLDVAEGWEERLRKWKEGMVIQKAFPELSPGDRELLKSGVCNECFDSMFKE